jgi:urease accessory protein
MAVVITTIITATSHGICWHRFRCGRKSIALPTAGKAPTMQAAAILHLLQLASPSLPIGAFSYSQGLEAAMEQGIVHDAASARVWITDALHQVVARFEAPVLWRLMQAFAARDAATVAQWTQCFIAARDTAEFRAETIQMGYSLGKLATELCADDTSLLAILHAQPEVPLPTAYAFAAIALDVPCDTALLGMLFSWAENQVLACVKSVPLGQVSGQRLLLSLAPELEDAAQQAQTLQDHQMSNWAPGLSLLSMQHEVQYSRLYRS